MAWIQTIPCGPYLTNAYLVATGNTEEALLVDAPPESFAPVNAELEKRGCKLKAVLITHPHFDHTLDVFQYNRAEIPVYAHPDAVDEIEHPEAPGGWTGGSVTHKIQGGSTLLLAGMNITVMDVPGHSKGSLAFLIPELKACFPGDVIFQGSVGRTDLPGGNFDVLEESIRTALYTLDETTVLFPGHGSSTSVGDEKKNNPFVRA